MSDPLQEARRLSEQMVFIEHSNRQAIEWIDAARGTLRALVQRVEDAKQEHRDLREILKAWGLGDTDKMQAVMLAAFLREFGKAPEPEPARQALRQEEERLSDDPLVTYWLIGWLASKLADAWRCEVSRVFELAIRDKPKLDNAE